MQTDAEIRAAVAHQMLSAVTEVYSANAAAPIHGHDHVRDQAIRSAAPRVLAANHAAVMATSIGGAHGYHSHDYVIR